MSKTLFEDESKDARYFPTDNEMQVLISALQVYFSHPERSIQRSQVVQNVVSVLSPSNNHWNHRTVRLWFNNNKRVFLRPSSPANNNKQMNDNRRDDSHSMFQAQQRCIIPRSLSVSPIIDKTPIPQINAIGNGSTMILNHSIQRKGNVKIQIGNAKSQQQQIIQLQFHPKRDSLALDFANENEYIMGNSNNLYVAQSKSESVITNKIIALYEKKWKMFVEAQQARTTLLDLSLSSFSQIDNSYSQKIDQTLELREKFDYDLIETSAITSVGDASIVSYDMDTQSQKLHFDGKYTDINLISPAYSMAVDEKNEVIWVHFGSFIKGFSMNNLDNIYELKISNRKSSKSAISFWGNNLVLATGSTVLLWNQEQIQTINKKSQDTFNVCLNLSLPSISSLTAIGDSLVVASFEHHTIQVYAKNGAIVSRSIGHSCGVTALHGYDENTFISGSADQTVKIWDLRVSQPIFKILKHKGVVTSVYGDCVNSPNIIFTGGSDGYVKGWDIREFKHLFSKEVCSTSPQSINYCSGNQKLSIVASEKTSDIFYDTEKFGAQNFQNSELPFNAILQYQYSP